MRKRLDDKGMSLVELIIVMAIMVIIGGGVGIGLAMAGNQYVPSCAKNLKSMIENTRTLALGKQNAYLELSKTDAGIMAQVYVVSGGTLEPYGDLRKVGNSSVEIAVGGAALAEGGDAIRIGFSRNNGRQVTDNGAVNVQEIKLTRGSRERTLELDILTGKVTVE